MRTTIKDVAAAAGVAVSTVSLALRDSRRVTAATRERVIAAAQRLGYRRNPAFAALGSRPYRRRRSEEGMPLAWIFQSTSRLRQAPWAPYFEPARRLAFQMGYRLVSYQLDQFSSPAQARRTLYARGVAGVIIEYFEDPAKVLAVDWSPFAVVACGAFSTPLPFNTVRGSNFSSSRLAYQQTWQAGYRRIGIASFQHQPAFFDDWGRIGGALAAEVELRGALGPIPPLTCPFEERARLIPWLESYRPDAVVGFPIMVEREMNRAGWRVPDRVAFTSMALDPEHEAGIAGVTHLREEIGRAAVELLDQNIRLGMIGRVESPRTIAVGCRWIPGPSLPPLQRA